MNKRRVLMRPQPPSSYPRFYMYPCDSGTISLVAEEGEQTGAVLGYLSGNWLRLYGVKNFRKNGGMAWQMNGRRHQCIEGPESVVGIVRRGKWWWLLSDDPHKNS